jgi:hypothetical protein
MTLHSEKQLEFIESIERSKRMLFVDSTGGSVKVTKQMRDGYKRVSHLNLNLIQNFFISHLYSKIQNYVFLLKDLTKLHELL